MPRSSRTPRSTWAGPRRGRSFGWPRRSGGDDAAGTAPVAAGTTADDNGRAAFEAESIFPIGKPNDAYAEYFDGQSYLAPVSTEQISIANVTFEPGCRNHWHIHHATEGGGQLLLCVAGHGWYQEWGKPARALVPGDVVNIPANVKHWHGAAANSWFGHLAMSVPGTDTSNEWCEPVSDEDYANLGKRVPGMRPHASRTAKRPPRTPAERRDATPEPAGVRLRPPPTRPLPVGTFVRCPRCAHTKPLRGSA